MLRQPTAALLLLFVSIAGALATHDDQSTSWNEAVLPPQTAAPHRLDPAAAAQARAEWEDILRSAEVRLMALERIQEDPVTAPQAIQNPTEPQNHNLPPHLTPNPGLESPVAKLAPVAQRVDDTGGASSAPTSGAGVIATRRGKTPEPWIHDFSSSR